MVGRNTAFRHRHFTRRAAQLAEGVAVRSALYAQVRQRLAVVHATITSHQVRPKHPRPFGADLVPGWPVCQTAEGATEAMIVFHHHRPVAANTAYPLPAPDTPSH